jgi:SNF2 family DNA or RNA helicase
MNDEEIRAEIFRLQTLLQENAKIENERIRREAAELEAKKPKVPDIYADYDKSHSVVVFNMQASAPTNIFYSSNGLVEFHRGYNKYVMNISQLYSLQSLLDKFAERYPDRLFVLSDAVRDDLAKEVAQHNELMNILNADGANLPEIILNGFKLKDEQVKAIELLKHNDGNGIIALKMGKGKTPVGLGYPKWYWDNVDPKQKFLIVSPATLRPNWLREAKKFLGAGEPVYTLSGTTPQSIDVQELITKNDYRLFYVNYDLIARGMKIVKDGVTSTVFPWPAILNMAELRLILDEGHYIKNPSAARSQAIHQCKFKSSAILTGTPMKNGPGELYTLMRQIKPGFAGSYQGWINTHTLNNGKIARNADMLRQILEPIMYRPKTYSDDNGMTPINRITIEYELTDNAKKLYNQVLQGFYADLAKWDGTTDNSSLINSLLVEMMRMKQVCAADKVEFVAERAIDTYDSDESEHRKVIIFSQFANEPPIVERIHHLLGAESVMFTGNNDVSDRQKIVDRFQNDSGIHFLVCSTKAASEGLNITAAGHVIFCDLLWTPSDHQQAEGRAYNRISDPHSITSTYVIASDTIEDHIVGILMRKMGEISKIVDGNNDVSSANIMKELLGEMRQMRMLK